MKERERRPKQEPTENEKKLQSLVMLGMSYQEELEAARKKETRNDTLRET